MVKRFEVWLVSLDPTVGREVKKTRPCLVVSPDQINRLQTSVIIPMTSQRRALSFRVNCIFDGREGQLMLDQIKAVDNNRLIKKLGRLDDLTCKLACKYLQEFFKY